MYAYFMHNFIFHNVWVKLTQVLICLTYKITIDDQTRMTHIDYFLPANWLTKFAAGRHY